MSTKKYQYVGFGGCEGLLKYNERPTSNVEWEKMAGYVIRLRGSFGLTLIGFRPELKPKGYVFQRPPYDDYRYEQRNRNRFVLRCSVARLVWFNVEL